MPRSNERCAASNIREEKRSRATFVLNAAHDHLAHALHQPQFHSVNEGSSHEGTNSATSDL